MSKTAFIFPGQGAQKAGMGKDFYENSEQARNLYEQASEALGLDMKALCFEPNDQLDITEYTQAALTVTCLAMAREVLRYSQKPDMTAGLSLGEYSAIAVAGGMTDLDVIRAVRKRGILMQEAVPVGEGAMSAVLGLTGEAVEELIRPIADVGIANYNCPGQIVITGKTAAVKEASEVLAAGGAKRVVPLNVSGPFHSPFLKTAGERLGDVLAELPMQPLMLPYVTNVTAEFVTDIGETKALLMQQVASSVRWQQSVERMIEAGADVFVEIGPGRTLAGFLRKIDPSVKVYNVSTWEDLELWKTGELRRER